ncbi:putative Lipoprotein [Gammaproteobacteria bacterium]
MSRVRPSRWVGELIVVVVLSGCAYAPPIQEMSDARQSVRAAADVEADRYFPTLMKDVVAQLTTAEKRLAVADYRGAEQQALAAKSDAVRVRGMVLTLTSTMELITQAERITQLKPSTRAILQQALNAALQGGEAVAMVLAEQARQEAESALEEHDLERAQTLAANLRSQSEPTQNAELRAALENAEAAIQRREGHQAYGLLAPYAYPP